MQLLGKAPGFIHLNYHDPKCAVKSQLLSDLLLGLEVPCSSSGVPSMRSKALPPSLCKRHLFSNCLFFFFPSDKTLPSSPNDPFFHTPPQPDSLGSPLPNFLSLLILQLFLSYFQDDLKLQVTRRPLSALGLSGFQTILAPDHTLQLLKLKQTLCQVSCFLWGSELSNSCLSATVLKTSKMPGWNHRTEKFPPQGTWCPTPSWDHRMI